MSLVERLLAFRAYQVSETGAAADLCPGAPEVANGSTVFASEYLIIGALALNALHQHLPDPIGHDHFSTLLILSGTRIQSNRAGASRVMGLHKQIQIGRPLRLAISRQLGCSFCRVPLKQACVGSGQCHPNSMPFSQQHGRGIH
jgi:hypothetical protein